MTESLFRSTNNAREPDRDCRAIGAKAGRYRRLLNCMLHFCDSYPLKPEDYDGNWNEDLRAVAARAEFTIFQMMHPESSVEIPVSLTACLNWWNKLTEKPNALPANTPDEIKEELRRK